MNQPNWVNVVSDRHIELSSSTNTPHPTGGDRRINPDQFDQVIEAILSGKYSWACVLILRFAGYNPLHYIPYRTYSRLVKEQGQLRRKGVTDAAASEKELSADFDAMRRSKHGASSKIQDLTYLDPIADIDETIQGGYRRLKAS